MKRKSRKSTSLLTSTKMRKGNVGSTMIFAMVGLMVVLGVYSIGGITPINGKFNKQEVKVLQPNDNVTEQNLQLKTFGFVTIAPTPANYGKLCEQGGVNNEPEILVGYSPAEGQTVSQGGQIKVWVNDEGAPFIAPNEQVDLTTGKILVQGDRSAKAADNFLYEPALYIMPNSAETGGTPHFPNFIKGQFNNNPPSFSMGRSCNGIEGATIDTPPSGASLTEECTAEFIWDVASLGLTSGAYTAEFVIHDGDKDRGVGCVNINIQ